MNTNRRNIFLTLALLLFIFSCSKEEAFESESPIDNSNLEENVARLTLGSNNAAVQFVKNLGPGWNLGNSLDSHGPGPDETRWGNPKTTNAMIKAVKAKGFKTLRVPVTWYEHVGGAPNYTINSRWMARVKEVVNYGLNNGMTVILNMHHEDYMEESNSFPKTKKGGKFVATGKVRTNEARLKKVWTQIANAFKSKGNKLVFEVLNEPRPDNSFGDGQAHHHHWLNFYNQVCVNAIRATGGKNTSRFLMIPTLYASATTANMNALKIPKDSKGKEHKNLIASIHSYYPWPFVNKGEQAIKTWTVKKDEASLINNLSTIKRIMGNKGLPVILGEWGTTDKDNIGAREIHANAYSWHAKRLKMGYCYWDNGNITPALSAGGAPRKKVDYYGIFNRKTKKFHFTKMAESIAKPKKPVKE